MDALTADEIVRIWELGQSRQPLERAMLILSIACREMPRAELLWLSIGQRDARLWHLRRLTFGTTLDGFTPCPHCCHSLQFSLDVAAIGSVDPAPVTAEYTFSQSNLAVRFRLLNTQDLLAIADNRATARSILLQRCLLEIQYEGETLSSGELPSDAIAQFVPYLAQCDPQAEVVLDLTCPVCQTQWQAILDISTFFWQEITARAKRLLREVHLLARCYGWREHDILSLSDRRRQYYLEMVEDE